MQELPDLPRAIVRERMAGDDFETIGQRHGMTKQGAEQRFKSALGLTRARLRARLRQNGEADSLREDGPDDGPDDGGNVPTGPKGPTPGPRPLNSARIQTDTPQFKKWFGDWQAMATRSSLESMEPVEITSNAPSDQTALRAWANETYQRDKSFTNKATGRNIKLVNSGLKKLRNHSAESITLRLIPGLQKLIENALPLYLENDRGDGNNIRVWHNYGVKAKVDGQEVFIRLTTWQEKGGELMLDLFHDAHATDAALMREIPNRGSPQAKQDHSSGFDKDKLRAWWHSVNPEAVSKIVNSDGSPRLVGGMFVKHDNNDFDKLPWWAAKIYEEGQKIGKAGFNTTRHYWGALNYDENAPDPSKLLRSSAMWDGADGALVRYALHAGLSGGALPTRFVFAERMKGLPERGYSYNYRDQTGEAGVSVLGLLDPEKGLVKQNDGTYELFNDGELHYVGGWLLEDEKGSDGEPLLLPVTFSSPKKKAQIKSAIGNNGDFDPKNPSILASSPIDDEAIRQALDALAREKGLDAATPTPPATLPAALTIQAAAGKA